MCIDRQGILSCSLADVAHNIPPTSSLSPATNWPTLPAGKMDFKRPIVLPRHLCRLKMAVLSHQSLQGVFVWSGDQHGRAMHSRNVGQLASPTVCMYPNSTRIALLTRERKRTHFPRGPTGLFILHFNNFTKTCQQLTNLSGEGLQRSSNLKTRLLYAIPTWIGKTAGEKLKN